MILTSLQSLVLPACLAFYAAAGLPVSAPALQPASGEAPKTESGSANGAGANGAGANGVGQTFGALLRAIGGATTPASDDGATASSQTDPTTPSEEVLSRLPIAAVAEPSSQRRGTTPRTVAPMPAIPAVTIRGIVLSSAVKGTAVIDVEGETLSIELIPRQQQNRVPIPQAQFAALRPALEERLRASTDAKNAATPAPDYEMCLRCSFAAAGVVFNVEAFTADSLLLRAIPHDSLVLVRR